MADTFHGDSDEWRRRRDILTLIAGAHANLAARILFGCDKLVSRVCFSTRGYYEGTRRVLKHTLRT